MFEESYNTLQKGEVLFLFPEGTSTTSPTLLDIKPGTARLALGLLQKTGIKCPIVPVGLNYTQKDKLRSQVLIRYVNSQFASHLHSLN